MRLPYVLIKVMCTNAHSHRIQLIDVTPDEIQGLSNYLGHNVTKIKETIACRHQPEIKKVGKLLMSIDRSDCRFRR
jgi:hypothetical protein